MSPNAAAEAAPDRPASEVSARGPVRLRLGEWLSAWSEWFDPTKQRALTALSIRVVGAAIAYGMQILLAQWMGLTQYGVFVAVWVWLLVLGGIAPLGLNVRVIGLLSAFHGAGEHGQWRGVLVSSVLITMCSGIVMASVGWSVLYFAPGLVADLYLLPLWFALFCVPLMALSDINEGISRAHGWMNTALMPTYLLRPLVLISGAFVVQRIGITLDAKLVLSLAIVACFVTVIIQSVVMIVRLARLNGAGAMSATPAKWLLAALPIVVAQTFELITQNFDMIAVSYFLGPESTGLYFAALKTIALLAFVNFAVGAATANRVASLHAAGSTGELETMLKGAVNMAFWPSVAGAVVLVSVSPMLLMLFGRDFAGHAYLTAILAVGFVAKSFVGPAELYLNVLGHQRTCAAILLVAAFLNLALNILLIPLIGLAGAAVATSTSLVVLAAGLFVLARRRIGVCLRPSLPSWRSAPDPA